MITPKKFGVWMDAHHATIVGDSLNEEGKTEILAHVTGETATKNSSEKNANNHEKTVQAKFFKEITFHLQNATEIHISGTGQAQEQFIHYLASTPQFKNTKTAESTSNKMSDEKLLSFFSEKN
ncbi:MAG: hypothetical protein ABIT58_06765 [Ferruginibacter sp.]